MNSKNCSPNKYNINRLIVFLLISILYIRDIAVLFNLEGFASFLFIALFCVLGLIIFFSFISFLGSRIRYRNAIIFLLGFFILTFITIITVYSVGFDLIENAHSTIGILLLVAFLIFEPIINVDNRIISFFLGFNLLFSVLLCVLALFPFSYDSAVLTYNYANPNGTGLYIFLAFGYVFLYLIRVPQCLREKKLILSCLLFFLLVLCFLTGSRTSIIGCLCVVFLYSLCKKNAAWLKICTPMFLLMPIAVPAIWIGLLSCFKYDFMLLNKPFFSGREVIWSNIFKIASRNPFSIHFNQFVPSAGIGYYGLSSHNAFLSIMWNYSLPVMILLYSFFALKVYHTSTKVKSRLGIGVTAVLLSIFFHMTFEDILLSGEINNMLKAFFAILMIGGIENEQ